VLGEGGAVTTESRVEATHWEARTVVDSSRQVTVVPQRQLSEARAGKPGTAVGTLGVGRGDAQGRE
jgi:hypothetical protein